MSKLIPDDQYNQEETARRRDEVIRRMANTPPQPKTKTPVRSKRKMKVVASAVGAGQSPRIRPRLDSRGNAGSPVGALRF
jgi:hypothetical protein